MEDETLLPLHREFSDKEKYEWCNNHRNELKQQLRKLEQENKRLINQAEDLKKEIAEWKADIPASVDTKATVTGKTYNKARKQLNDMVASFWRVNDELRELKKNMPSEKL